MTLGVVVVAYQDAVALDHCLASLAAVQDVLVANVAAASVVADVARAHQRRELRIDANVGYAAAVNESVSHLPAGCDTVLFMNDDVRLCSDPPEVGGTSVRIPRQRSPSGEELRVVHRLPTPLGFCREWVFARRSPERGAGRALPPGTFGNAAAVIAPRSVLEEHPLPAEYFLYWEEAAWFWRLADASVHVRFDDDIVVERPPGAAELSDLKARLLGENLIRLAVERYGARAAVPYLLLGGLWLARLVITDSFRPDRRRRWRARSETLRGLVLGVRSVRAERRSTTHG